MSWNPPPGPGAGATARPEQPQQVTLYQLLQVDPNAHPTIIRYAYRYLAGIYHPDNVDTGNPEMFRVVSDAFRTLSDAGRRAAYDAQVGIKPPPPNATVGGSGIGGHAIPNIPKTGLSYNEVELRLAVLQILLTARKKRAQTGGASAKVLMDILNVDIPEMEFVLWYLREKGYVLRSESIFQITVMGVDYLVDSLGKAHSLDDGGRSAPVNVNLPATIN